MFKIKICGLTRAIDVRAAVEAGADAIGLNFYGKSQRAVTLEQAKELAAYCPAGVAKVGVFVNMAAADIRRIASQVPLDAVQLHGDESPEIMRELSGLAVIRAIRPAADEWSKWREQIGAFCANGKLAGVLVDAPSLSAFGGTGQTADWQAVAEHGDAWRELPLVLAGGLKPENVAAAIRAVRPQAVDTASGVESSSGIKDAPLIRAFVANAREAFHQLGSRL